MSDERTGIESQIRERAAGDPEFRAALLADARAAVGEALGIEIPATLNLRIVEESADEVVLVIPAATPAVADLDDSDLETAAGGGNWGSAGSCNTCVITCSNQGCG